MIILSTYGIVFELWFSILIYFWLKCIFVYKLLSMTSIIFFVIIILNGIVTPLNYFCKLIKKKGNHGC